MAPYPRLTFLREIFTFGARAVAEFQFFLQHQFQLLLNLWGFLHVLAVTRLSGSCRVFRAKGQGVHPNDNHPERQNRRRRILIEIWCPKTILKYPHRGTKGNLHAVDKRFENN